MDPKDSKVPVAAVEDYDSVIQEAIPTSRREAFKKRASGLASVTNSSDTGTIDSGYSSNSTANILGEHFGESPPRPDNQGELSHIGESTATRPTLSQSNSTRDGRTSRPSGHPQRTSGSYSYGPGSLPTYRPASRASKSTRDGRASPAVRCPPPINTGVGGDECDCKDCEVKSAAQPSPMLSPTLGGLESSWAFDLRNNLPYASNGINSWTAPLSTSPGHSRGLSGSRNGFPFETFTTSDSANPTGSFGSSHSLNYASGSNPLVNPLPGWTTQHDYTASPGGYTPTSVNPLHSPPPYRGSSSNWMAPPTPGGLSGTGVSQSYDDYDYQSSQDYLYGNGPSAATANNGMSGTYDLPPRSASVQPLGSTRNKRSNTYHHRERTGIPDFSSMPPPHPAHRRSNSRVPAGKKPHSATNSHDNGYEPFDANAYDSGYVPTFDEYAPPPPINRRLSRSSATPPQYPDIARATSVPPVDNYVTSIDKARRMSSMTPQPLAITQRERERNRRGSNSSSGLSAARRAAHELQLDQLVEQVVVEKRPDLALTKRSSNSNRHEHAELSYSADAYDSYDGYPAYEGYGQEYGQEYMSYEGPYDSSGMDLGANEQGMVLKGDLNSDPYAIRYPGVGVSSKLPTPASNDPYHRPGRVNVERRKSMHRRNSDFPHSRDPLASGAELELMRSGSISRGSGADKRTRRQIEYDLGGYY